MNIYLVKRNMKILWSTYDAFVCYASSVEEAKSLNPETEMIGLNSTDYGYGSWIPVGEEHLLEATLLGTGDYSGPSKIILSSYNSAG